MAIHSNVSPEEAADRLAIRELVDAYAYCADRRDAKGQMALFTPDTHFIVHMDSKSDTPTQEMRGRDSLAPVFDKLNNYETTMHFNGQSSVQLDGNRARGRHLLSCASHLTTWGQAQPHDCLDSLYRYIC